MIINALGDISGELRTAALLGAAPDCAVATMLKEGREFLHSNEGTAGRLMFEDPKDLAPWQGAVSAQRVHQDARAGKEAALC